MDASPLILLGKSGQLEWLPRMGQVIIIPQSVATEVAAGSPDDPARLWLESPVGADMKTSDTAIIDELLAWDLGRGETAVIAMAMENPGYEAVLDDAAARRCAAVFGVSLRGTLSFVALAKKRGLISACRPVFEEMQKAGLFVSQKLVDQVALSVGE
jgi:predicted nucleic acid-binding protein